MSINFLLSAKNAGQNHRSAGFDEKTDEKSCREGSLNSSLFKQTFVKFAAVCRGTFGELVLRDGLAHRKTC